MPALAPATFVQELIDTYGYLAVLVGTFLEGETILVLGGLAVHLGYLEMPWVIALAFVGSLSGDQLWFFLGRRYGQAVLARHPAWRERVDRVHAMLRRYELAVLIGFRFAYGLRNLTPFVVGLTRIGALKFTVCNALGALIWSVSIAYAGYLFGRAIELLLGDIKRYELEVMSAVVIVGLLTWSVYLVARRLGKHSVQSPDETR